MYNEKRTHYTAGTLLLVIALGGTLYGAPRSVTKHLSTDVITLQMLNVTTVIPGGIAGGNAHDATKKRTIHNVCKRIHNQINHHVIDTTIYDEDSCAGRYCVKSGVVPTDQDVIFVYSTG